MLSTMIEALERALDADDRGEGVFPAPVADLQMLRFYAATPPRYLLYKPTLCVALQGRKHALQGDRAHDYGPMQGLVVGLDMPMSSRVQQASPDRPFLGITIGLDLAAMRDMLEQMDAQSRADDETGCSVFAIDIDGPLADCLARLVLLLDQPEALRVLYPGIQRELNYWLAKGPHGARVCSLVGRHASVRRIATALDVLRQRYDQPIRVPELAELVNMSASVFHQRFRALTSLSPLQYQKQIRLLEARRMMLEQGVNAETAARHVGYESASHFSREYSRQFGAPPRRDTATPPTRRRRSGVAKRSPVGLGTRLIG